MISDIIIQLDPKIDPKSKGKNIKFDIQGKGLHKSIINGIRRTLLSSIPTVAFRTDDGNSDMIIKKNNTSLHNEFLSHRISLIPLYINPIKYKKDYLFHLDVQNNPNEPITTITAEDFKIYPLKEGIQLNDESEISIDNYDQSKPLSDKEKVKIFQPYRFQSKNEYCIITELKLTKSSVNQDLELYGVPSVSFGYEDARWQAVSRATYSFKKDEELFQKILQEKINVNQIQKKDRIKYEKELRISESERYFYRDQNAEPYWYTFTIDSVHYLSSKELFILAIQLIIDQFELFMKELPKLSVEENTFMNLSSINEDSIFIIKIQGFDDTIGNIIQSYVSMNMIDDDSILSVCGYKKKHPLEDIILLNLSLNPNNNMFNSNKPQKVVSIIQVLQEASSEIIKSLSIIQGEAEKKL